MRIRDTILRALTALLLLGSAAGVSAQRAPTGEFSVLRFSPAPGAHNYLGLDGAATRGNVSYGANLLVDYANRPFSLYQASTCDEMGNNCMLSPGRTDLVANALVFHISAYVVLLDRLQIGVVIPLAYLSGDPFSFTSNGMPAQVGGGSTFGLADPRLHVKLNLIDSGHGFRLGVAAYGTAPLGQATAKGRFLGESTPTFGGHIIAEYTMGGFRVGGNVGGVWRDGATLFSTEARGQLTYGLGVAYDLTSIVGVVGEVAGATSFTSQVDENMLEGRLAGLFRVGDVNFTLGGGVGIIGGVGVPAFRVLGGIGYAPVSADSDHDGILDATDGCPSEAEDVDDYEDEDGCPEADNDQDGILDADDRCPSRVEDMDGENDTDGCPDSDNDHDGVDDGYDSCPSEQEDMDGDRDEDGCPDNDRDRDNVADDVDPCPDQAEDTDGWGDEDGCPETDFDNDGLPDDADQCPDQPEDMDGWEDEDGCHDDIDPAPTARRRRHH